MQYDNSFERAAQPKPAVSEQVRNLGVLRLQYIEDASRGILQAIQRNPDLQIVEAPEVVAEAPKLVSQSNVIPFGPRNSEATPEAIAPNAQSRSRQNLTVGKQVVSFDPTPIAAPAPVKPVDEVAQGLAAVERALAGALHPLNDPSLAILRENHFENRNQQHRAA